jgi:uncharacterized protein
LQETISRDTDRRIEGDFLSPLDQGLGVVTDRLNRATFHGFLAKSLLLGSLGLLENIGMTAVIVTLEISRSSLAAQVAIDALVIAVVSARNILRILVGYISHNERKVKSPLHDCNGFFTLRCQNRPFVQNHHSMTRNDDLNAKEKLLKEILMRHAPLLIAYSGGVDSTLLLAMAHKVLDAQATGIIADSPSLPRAALAEALRVAEGIGAVIEVVTTTELEDPRYAENPINRCYFCKAELFTRMDQIAKERGVAAIAYGENADDPAHLRPGSQAAAEFSVIAPLKDAGLTKADVRELSRRMGLPTAEAPAQPCLSSRIPHGTPVTREALDHVERGEAIVRQFGFRIFRVRYQPPEESGHPGAKVQVAAEEMPRLETTKATLIAALSASGFRRVEIDPEPLKR